MRAWFERLADEVPAPLFLYNIPMTTKMSIPVATVEALSAHPNIAGIKDSEYDVGRMETLLARLKDRSRFACFVGPSILAKQGLALGASGFVPGVGNVMPDACQRLMVCAEARDWEGAEQAQALMKRIGDTYQAGRTVAEAIAMLKAAMNALGLCSPVVLPPLVPPSETDRRAVAAGVAELLGRNLRRV
jgi:4-hydroxy-tetrahydrodipicolinate synthase